MTLIRLILKEGGHNVYDFYANIIKPELGEIISMGISEKQQEDFKVTFIQFGFDKNKNYKYMLVTGVKI